MTKTCKNCGHDERHHKKNRFYPEVKEGECLALRGFKEACTCKKFEAVKGFPLPQIMKISKNLNLPFKLCSH